MFRLLKIDLIILEFLKYGKLEKQVTENYMSCLVIYKQLHSRIINLNLEGIKVHKQDQQIVLTLQDLKYGKINLKIYEDKQLIILQQKKQKPQQRPKNKKLIQQSYNKFNLFTKQCVNACCYDFTDIDKLFMISEINKKKNLFVGPGSIWISNICAMIFLIARCPANSDFPLKETQILERIKLIKHISRSSFSKILNKLKLAGLESCRITYEIILLSSKDKLLKIYNKESIDISGTIEKAICLSKTEKIRKIMLGRNPYSVSAGLIYYCHTGHKLSKIQLSTIFNISPVTLLKVIRLLESEFPIHPTSDHNVYK